MKRQGVRLASSSRDITTWMKTPAWSLSGNGPQVRESTSRVVGVTLRMASTRARMSSTPALIEVPVLFALA